MSFDRPPVGDDLIRGTARRIAEDAIAPLAEELDREHRFPHEIAATLHEVGFLSLLVPEEHGGGGGTLRDVATIAEELAYGDVSTTMIFTLQTTCTELVQALARGEQREALNRRIVDGALMAIAITEPEAGSDAAALRTTARPDGDDYVVNGSKIYITNADVADLLLVMVQTGEVGDRKGIRLAIVEADAPGVSIAGSEGKMGLNGSATCEIGFDGVRVPADRVVGEPGEAYAELLGALVWGRVSIGAVGVGVAQAALDRASDYARLRHQFGRPIGSFQGLQFLLADMAMATASARAMIDAAVAAEARGDANFPVAAAAAKCVATDAAMRVTTDAVQVFGGAGYMRETGIERLMRDAKILQIFEGTNQIMRSIVGQHLVRRG